MYIKLRKGYQRKLLTRAIKKAGSERKLAKIVAIPNTTISNLKLEKNNISESKFTKICSHLKIDPNCIAKKTLPKNWGQIKGGRNLIIKKKQEKTFDVTIQKLKIGSSKYMKKWHSDMKKNHPAEYYTWQYERFKKIGKGYRYKLSNGIYVRNTLEQDVGNYLLKYFAQLKYEPYLNINGKAYFPDFKINNVLIEVTEWKHPSISKIRKLNTKISDYKKQGFIICFYIPKAYRKFYKGLICSVESALPKLADFINASVA